MFTLRPYLADSADNSRPRWLSWMRRPTGDQEVTGSTPAELGNILSWRLIMKYFLRSFSPFRWFKKGSCQFLAKECIYCTKTTQIFFGHVFFSVTETDVTIKIYKEYSKMDWKRMKQMKQTNSSSHWWSVSFVSFVTKQDVTVQKTCSKLVTKHGETEWNDETYIFFFYKPISVS